MMSPEVLETYVAKVNEALTSLGVNLADATTDEPNKWYVNRVAADKYAANVVIFIRESETYKNEIQDVLVVLAPIMKLPKNPELRLRLLEVVTESNYQAISETFSMHDGELVMRSTCYLDQVDAQGIARIVDNLSYYALYAIQEFSVEGIEELDEELSKHQA